MADTRKGHNTRNKDVKPDKPIKIVRDIKDYQVSLDYQD